MLGKSRHLNALEARRLRKIRLLAAVVLVVAALALGFYAGQRFAYNDTISVVAGGKVDLAPVGYGVNTDAAPLVAPELAKANEQIVILKRELDMRATRHQVDLQALEMVRSEITEQKEQISDLAEGLNFYQSLMAPDKLSQGLSLRPLELVLLESPGRFSFRIVAQQEALKHSLLKGELAVVVVGALNGEPVSYPLAELSENVEASPIVLRFRYFQTIQGELNLPPGFVPERIDMMASAKKPRKMEVKESYPWHLQERFTHVGN